jgi:hypothetical protein
MSLVQVAGKDPVDVDLLGDFVDGSSHEFEGHSFHYNKLYCFFRHLADLHDRGERDAALVFVLRENVFKESNHAYFLLQVSEFLHDVWESRSIFLVLDDGSLEFINLSVSEGLEQIVKPLKVSAD